MALVGSFELIVAGCALNSVFFNYDGQSVVCCVSLLIHSVFVLCAATPPPVAAPLHFAAACVIRRTEKWKRSGSSQYSDLSASPLGVWFVVLVRCPLSWSSLLSCPCPVWSQPGPLMRCGFPVAGFASRPHASSREMYLGSCSPWGGICFLSCYFFTLLIPYLISP